MKRIPGLLLTFAALVALVAVMQHLQSRRTRAALERERLQLGDDTQRARAEQVATERQVEAARARVVPAAPRTNPGAGPTLAAAPDAGSTAGTPARASVAPANPDPGLRRARILTFAGEQRMQFAPLLHRLGFTPAQRQAFDRINEEYYHAMLDEKVDAAGLEVARSVRAEALRELFGVQHETWREANQQAMARGIVDGIIHQTFPSSGALNAAQADELTRIVAHYRLPASGARGPATFDWDRIIEDARTILADRQMKDFISAVSHRRATEQMSALAATAKP